MSVISVNLASIHKNLVKRSPKKLKHWRDASANQLKSNVVAA